MQAYSHIVKGKFSLSVSIVVGVLFLVWFHAPQPAIGGNQAYGEWRIEADSTIQRIKERGVLLVGTTGDYRPLTFREEDGRYWGFGIELAEIIAKRLGVGIEFVPTSWPTLTNDVTATPPMFDLAIGGITITEKRCETMLMSDGYLANGKTILCRTEDAHRYASLADINRPEVRVMVNPGGTNELLAKDSLPQATLIIHRKNEEIPSLIAEGKADIMVTEITEAPYYIRTDSRLAAPLLNKPFTHAHIGVLMPKGEEDLLELVNTIIKEMKADGTLRKLHEKYRLNYLTTARRPGTSAATIEAHLRGRSPKLGRKA